jgi:hypothetical protein
MVWFGEDSLLENPGMKNFGYKLVSIQLMTYGLTGW